MNDHIPPQAPNSFRIILEVTHSGSRLDNVLLAALRGQSQNIDLKNISRLAFKELFKNGKILIKGQKAKPSSGLARGTTYVDLLGFK